MNWQNWAMIRRPKCMARAPLVAAVALMVISHVAAADDAPDLLNDEFRISVGTFGINSDPEIHLRGRVQDGGKVNFDRQLGGGDQFRARVDAQWRFAERHKAYFAAFGLNRSNSRVLDRDIEWGDEIYPVGGKAEFSSDFWVLQAVYDYSFLRRETYEVGASIGVHWTSLSAGIKLKADVNGNPVTDSRNESASVDLPLPVVGVRGQWKLPYDLWVEGSAQFFALSIDEYDGSLQDYRVSLIWQPSTWVGVGVGYERFTVDVDVDKQNFDGSLDWTYDGPMVFYTVSF
jgi:hypothetical protein